MSYLHGTALVPGAYHYGGDGLGVLGSAVPSAGDNGPGYLYNDLSLPADAGKEVRGLIETFPVGLSSFDVLEDSSFSASGPDGVYTFTYRLYVDGADLGSATGTITIGVVSSGTLTGGVTLDDLAVSGSISSFGPGTISGSIAVDDVIAGGSLGANAAALSGTITLDGMVASGAFQGQPLTGGTMLLSDLIADLKASLQDSAKVFTAAADADFVRHLEAAAQAFSTKRPRTILASLTLTADTAEYPAPDDFMAFKASLWGTTPVRRSKPWEKSWPGPLPRVRFVEVGAGSYQLSLEPSPSAAQIAALGADFRYYYFARHVLDDTLESLTTIRPGERGLLLLRAQAEAMRELAMRNITKPVQMRDGVTSGPRNGTPAALFAVLHDEFLEASLP